MNPRIQTILQRWEKKEVFTWDDEQDGEPMVGTKLSQVQKKG